ncbi:MAG: type II secretion system F family protein [Candidatus Neomarinimicrobiota bacterium]
MAQFQVKSINEFGKIIDVVVNAEDKMKIYEQADAKNESIVSIKNYKEPFSFSRLQNRFYRVKPQELENFTAQLVVMLKAGVPLIESLGMIGKQLESEKMEEIVQDIIDKVNAGMIFSKAINHYPRVFNSLYVSMAKVGETTGSMDTVLDHVKNFLHHDIAIKRKVKSAMRYPIIVMSVLGIAFTAAIVFIIPQFSTMFASADIVLPLPTRILIFLSDMITTYWAITLTVSVIVISLLKFYLNKPGGAYQFDTLKLMMPVFKNIVLESSIARFARVLETLSKSGVKIIKALEITRETIENRVISRDIKKATEKVTTGISIADALSESKHFPQMTLMMIGAGERSGALEAMLSNIAEQYDTSVDLKIEGLSAAIEPILTIVIAAFLLVFALAIFLPMWSMTDVIGK